MAGRKRGKSRAERTEEMRQDILTASLELFVEQGYEKTTTRQILQKVGILNGSLYNIYRSKEDIFSDIIVKALRDILRMGDEWLPADSPVGKRFCFPFCVQLYAGARSPRAAELISIALRGWDIHERVVSVYGQWLRDSGPEGRAMADAPGFESRMDMCLGATGMVVDRMHRDPGSVDEGLMMRLICRGHLSVFGLDETEADAYVDDTMAILGSRPLVLEGFTLDRA